MHKSTLDLSDVRFYSRQSDLRLSGVGEVR